MVFLMFAIGVPAFVGIVWLAFQAWPLIIRLMVKLKLATEIKNWE